MFLSSACLGSTICSCELTMVLLHVGREQGYGKLGKGDSLGFEGIKARVKGVAYHHILSMCAHRSLATRFTLLVRFSTIARDCVRVAIFVAAHTALQAPWWRVARIGHDRLYLATRYFCTD